MQADYAAQAVVFKALCDETRLRVLELLHDGEKCACVLLEHLDIGQSSLSYHMKVLVESGIVASRPEGKWTHYHICPDGSQAAARLLAELTTPAGAKHGSSCCNNQQE